MTTSVSLFPRLVSAEEELEMRRPPDERAVKIAENLLIAALWNYRQTTTGESDEIVSYLDVPPVWRETFYRAYAVPVAVSAIWKEDGE